jgi:dTDP-4-amino-4,6-dideoxygalactose transaminase
MLQPNSVTVPFFDWPMLYAEGADDYRKIIDRTAATGGFILQSAVAEFEQALAAYVGVKHAIGLSDCTNAMLLGLRASGLQPGDEVILPSHAFIAAAQAIHFAGGTPVPVELLESDWLVDPDSIRSAITERTRAIMPVHVNGRVCAMDSIMEIAGEHNLVVVEDAAQALGARRFGRSAGSFGLWGAFSFYPSKTLGGFGDGGALVTDDDEVAETVRAMRNHGADEAKRISNDCAVWGTNSRLDNIHAAVLAHKLGWYDRAVERRREIARRYHDALEPIREIRLPPGPGDSDCFDVFQNFEICCDDRDGLRSHMEARGVGTIVQWGGSGIHHFRNLGFDQHLPRTDRFFQCSMLLPMNHLLSDEQVIHITRSVAEFFE